MSLSSDNVPIHLHIIEEDQKKPHSGEPDLQKSHEEIESPEQVFSSAPSNIVSLRQQSYLTYVQEQQWLRHKKRLALHIRHKHRSSSLRAGAIILLTILLFSLSISFLLTVSYGIQIYDTYLVMKDQATSGVNHLLEARNQLMPSSNDRSARESQPSQNSRDGKKTNNLLDPVKLHQASLSLSAAHHDFQQLQNLVKRNNLLQIVNTYLPQYRSTLLSVNATIQIGIDITALGQPLIEVAQVIAPRAQGSLLSEGNTPLLLPTDQQLFQDTLTRIQPLLNQIIQQAHLIDPAALPLSNSQRHELQQYLALLPSISLFLAQGHQFISMACWLIGVDQPRRFLVQTMDRGELRATGGFTGQYGELQINGGRIAPFSLTNVALLEYASDSPTYGKLAPEMYRSWWPFANWGLRDSNLSADFPTSAQLAISSYQNETHRHVDGAITFTPTFIQHALQVTSSIFVPDYNETITASNLEEKLHYYQLDGNGIAKEKAIAHVDDDEQARKQFTSTLSHLLMDHIRALPFDKLLPFSQQILKDLQTRDLQVYIAQSDWENWLKQNNYAGEIDRTADQDGLYVVQMNVSVSKASQYVQTQLHDNVVLDSTGGATHNLQMHLTYNQSGPVYGFDTYRDYIRVYVPSSAQLVSGNGFDQGYDQPLCGGYLGACPANHVYPHDELICPGGQYDAGLASPMLNDPYLGSVHPLDKIGGPTNQQSDEPGRAMFAGYAVIPKNCSLTLSLSWYVPASATHTLNNPGNTGKNYTLHIQRQAGTNPELEVRIQYVDKKSEPDEISYHSTMTHDLTLKA